MNPEELLGLAIRAALIAGEEVLKVYASDFTVENKSDHSPLTLADKNSHHVICKRLEETRIPVLSEEGKEIPYAERKKWRKLWIVDPLDGTKEFIKRNGEFTVNIALVEEGSPVLGVIYAPVKKVLYFSEKKLGAYRYQVSGIRYQEMSIGQMMDGAETLPVSQPAHPFTIVASRSHVTKETEDYITEMKKEHGDVMLISAGSSLKICLVAEGSADVYPRFGPTMEWDTAAGQAIAEGAGKRFVDVVTGKPMVYNRENLLNNFFIVQ